MSQRPARTLYRDDPLWLAAESRTGAWYLFELFTVSSSADLRHGWQISNSYRTLEYPKALAGKDSHGSH